MKSNYHFLIDSGHGGIIDNKYQTAGKRSYFKEGKLLNSETLSIDWLESNCDFKYYEGVGTRDIAARLFKLLDIHNIRYKDIVNSQSDISLTKRVSDANEIYKTDKSCIYISIHSDAFNKESAQGFSVYTSKGITKSDIISTYFFKEMAIEFAEHRPRADYSDGDPDKEENFYVLRKTAMPAILTENLFYTNWREAQILASTEGRQRIAEAHFKAIMKIEKQKPI